MRRIRIHGHSGLSTIIVGGALGTLGSYAPLHNTVVITDANVRRHHRHAYPPCAVIEISAGEQAKTLDTVKDICLQLMDMGADRSSFLVGIGGGVVCDITGFVASIYMRGLRFGLIPTTLLAQVDAAIGGKNGVNLDGYKNMVGVFNQPRFVLCDLSLLGTLPKRDLLSGFSEIVKHALIRDAELFSYVEANSERGLSLDPESMERLLYDSLVIKSSIVGRDEMEKDERRLLNFGHTFGHAVEKVSGMSHGEAVSIGMGMASRVSEAMGYLGAEDVQRIEALLIKLGLPVRLDAISERVFDAMRRDKKRRGEGIHFVLLKGVGQGFVKEMLIQELEEAI